MEAPQTAIPPVAQPTDEEKARKRILDALDALESDRTLNPDIPGPLAFQYARQFINLVDTRAGPIVGYADKHVTIRWRGTAVKISHDEVYGIWDKKCHILDIPTLAEAVMKRDLGSSVH